MGEQPVLEVDTSSKAGRRFIQIFPFIKDALLRAHVWSFALKRVSLPALSTTPSWGFDYEYQLPGDCLALLQVNDCASQPASGYAIFTDNSPYKIEGGKILTDISAPLKIRYIKNAEAAEFDSAFSEAISIKLALTLVTDITNNNGLMQNLQAMFKDSIKQALRGNAIEKAEQSTVDGDTVLSRI